MNVELLGHGYDHSYYVIINGTMWEMFLDESRLLPIVPRRGNHMVWEKAWELECNRRGIDVNSYFHRDVEVEPSEDEWMTARGKISRILESRREENARRTAREEEEARNKMREKLETASRLYRSGRYADFLAFLQIHEIEKWQVDLK